MEKMMKQLQDIAGAINNAETVVITAHQYPDGDAVGSSLALYHILTKIGKKVSVVLPKAQIGSASVLSGFDEIVDIADFDFSQRPDLLICLDCAQEDRICSQQFNELLQNCPVVNIDHHGKVLFGTYNYVIKDYSCTGELIYNLARFAGWELSLEAGEAIWIALITDTNNFSKKSTERSTFLCAAELLSLGVRNTFLHAAVMQEPVNVVELRRRAMNSLEFWGKEKVAVISLQKKDFLETGCMKKDTDEFPNIPLNIKGPVITAFVYPLSTDCSNDDIRLSLRSKANSPVTARSIAEHFGGAGHEDSAGALYHGTVDEARQALKNYLEHSLAEYL